MYFFERSPLQRIRPRCLMRHISGTIVVGLQPKMNSIILRATTMLLLIAANSVAAQGAELLQRADETVVLKGHAAAIRRVEELRARPTALAAAVFRWNKNASNGTVIKIQLPDDITITVNETRQEYDSKRQESTWLGKVKGSQDEVILVTTPTGVTGFIDHRGYRYNIEPLTIGGLHVVTKSDPRKMRDH